MLLFLISISSFFSIIIITFVALLSKPYQYENYITKQYVVMPIGHDVVNAISYHS